MLIYLRNEYGTMTPEELERNRSALCEPWNLNNHLEDLWAKISNIQRIATLGHVPIPDITIITLTLSMICKNRLAGKHHREVAPLSNRRMDRRVVQARVLTRQ